jgi:phage baseplate assembly protein W
MARNTRTFSDLDFNFAAHPVTGDITRKYDEEAIKQSVKNLVMTQHYERPFHSEIGSQLRGLLFEPATPMLNILIKRAITDTIINFEPRVKLIDVRVRLSPDTNEVYVLVEFSIVNTVRPITVTMTLKRTR